MENINTTLAEAIYTKFKQEQKKTMENLNGFCVNLTVKTQLQTLFGPKKR